VNIRPAVDAQAHAFADSRLAEIADAVVVYREAALIHLLRTILLSTDGAPPTDPEIEGILQLRSHWSPARMASARRVADKAWSIAQEPRALRGDLQGALVEYLVVALIATRDRGVRHSVSVQLTSNKWTGKAWTNPLDAFLEPRAGPVEAYECKHQVGSLDQDDLNQLEDVAATARESGKTCRPTFATLDTANAVRLRMKRIAARGTLYFAHKDAIIGLADGPPHLSQL
jgi:hypothetical protein